MDNSIGIIGSGPAALITAHTLIKDGFNNVRLITRDKRAGGIWARDRVYPGLSLNKYALVFPLYPSSH
jgi:cation diffusion facilitator CzcD-associated flavoprotein CzcO